MHELFKDPTRGDGFLGYAALGFFGAITALLVASFFPSIIPASAAGVRL